MDKTNKTIKVLVLVTYLAMVIVNILANTLPINGIDTGKVSDSYPNLFAPAPVTFAIWGLIYLLLAGYTLYVLGFFRGKSYNDNPVLLERTGLLFSISSLANVAWIFSWHYLRIPLSMVLMVVILLCLILINRITAKARLNDREKYLVRLPFSIYFGWITVATIANATTLLVSLGWKGFGLSEPVWTIIILAVGMLIGIATMFHNRDIMYGIVLIWAYLGILIKHISASGFGRDYPGIIITVIICIVLFMAAVALVARYKRRKRVLTF